MNSAYDGKNTNDNSHHNTLKEIAQTCEYDIIIYNYIKATV